MATIVTRSGKGSPLTHAEVDANFENLNTDKLETSGGTVTGSLDVSGDLTVDTDTLFVDASANRVGINNATPAHTLDVTGNVRMSGQLIDTGEDSTSTNVFIQAYRAGTAVETGGAVRIRSIGDGACNATQMIFDANGAEVMRVNTTGASVTGNLTVDTNTLFVNAATNNVGVRTISPATQLEVVGAIRTSGSGPRLSILDTGGATDEKEWSLAGSDGPLRLFAINEAGGGSGDYVDFTRVGNSVRTIRGARSGGTSYELSNFDRSLFFSNGVSTIGTATAHDLVVDTNNTERMRITSAGLVGIGTSSPAFISTYGGLQVNGSNGTTIKLTNPTTGATSTDGFELIVQAGGLEAYVWQRESSSLIFGTSATERMRITSAGSVGIGTSSPAFSSGDGLEISRSGTATLRVERTGATASAAELFAGNDQVVLQSLTATAPIIFRNGGDPATERLRITSTGSVGIGTAAPAEPLHVAGNGRFDGILYNFEEIRVNQNGQAAAANSNSAANAGARIQPDGNTHVFSAVADQVLLINRMTNDGALITFYGQGNAEGSISVSGSTITYGGGHLARWSRLPTEERADIPKGTVLTNLDAMVVWQKPDGTIENNEQLNQTEISSVEGDPNVAGVFDHWDNDDDEGYNSDFYVALTGDFIIRIAQGTTVQRGDLLMSAGDGTAKPQGDDIVRSKTIAKVTSTHVTCTYEDGSYCVPCVLMAC